MNVHPPGRRPQRRPFVTIKQRIELIGSGHADAGVRVRVATAIIADFAGFARMARLFPS
ncbi:hypothetical protein BV133_2999 [Blastochloris viridis]|uniref:Uncharacterized protein n=1 Tax=Blastochloris viridis TaxID=1079 RepID=A0A182D6Z7_BLAVI|nr:hypothetical protein BV133_2999 [Blastochloris viridis]